ncbi:MAG: ParB/RepB/Spo0J family partition protein [Burkholderiales bacterium]|nr:ParB/RepB/Spo0J family partition protein [Burkholderiales bacterium]
MALLLDHLALDQLPPPQRHGTPLLLPIDTIDEDPEQPRREFDPEAMTELAQTIAARGVRQPVSVRPHPQHPGRWMLNFGARRLRASKLAGKTEIPAFVDATADSYDQVVENEQRASLQPMELALFVQRRLALGDKQAEIARRLGKSRSYLTFVGALIDPPDWLLALYRSGRSRGLQELYELRKLHEANPRELAQWLACRDSISRADVLAYKAQRGGADSSWRQSTQDPAAPLTDMEGSTEPAPSSRPVVVPLRAVTSPTAPAPATSPAKATAPAPTGVISLWARFEGQEVVLDLSAMPSETGQVFVRPWAAGVVSAALRLAVPVGQLQLLRVARAPVSGSV